MDDTNDQPQQQPDVPDALLTYEERVHRVREGVLIELEGYELGGTDADYGIKSLSQAREVAAVAQTLEAIDRILYRLERAKPQLLPMTSVVNAPTEGELRTAIWSATEDAGYSTEVADNVIAGTLKRLGWEDGTDGA